MSFFMPFRERERCEQAIAQQILAANANSISQRQNSSSEAATIPSDRALRETAPLAPKAGWLRLVRALCGCTFACEGKNVQPVFAHSSYAGASC
jgi:hypothetical protein